MRSMRNTERVYKNKAALEVVDIEKQPNYEGENYRQHPFLGQ